MVSQKHAVRMRTVAETTLAANEATRAELRAASFLQNCFLLLSRSRSLYLSLSFPLSQIVVPVPVGTSWLKLLSNLVIGSECPILRFHSVAAHPSRGT